MEIHRILFPVDLTGFSSKVVPQVLSMARKFDAEVHLLYIAGTLEQFSTFFVPHPSLDQLELENVTRAERLLDEFANEHFGGYPRVKVAVLRGHPVKQIQNYVDTEGIDLIIVATHGRHGFERALFGSVADEIVTRSSVPVLCINAMLEEEKLKKMTAATGAGRKPAPQPEVRH